MHKKLKSDKVGGTGLLFQGDKWTMLSASKKEETPDAVFHTILNAAGSER